MEDELVKLRARVAELEEEVEDLYHELRENEKDRVTAQLQLKAALDTLEANGRLRQY